MNFDQMKLYQQSGVTRTYEFRKRSLDQLHKMVKDNSDRISEALYQDLRKPAQEALIAEVAFTLEEIRYTKKKLKSWMKPKCTKTPLALWPGKSRIYSEPLGVVLIIGPWNYPFQLLMAPLVGALAAGNCAVLKPSELTPHTSKLMAELIRQTFSPEYVQVVEGGVEQTTELLQLKFDHIFFTGSTGVGKVIMAAAAKHLTPVTLELGGKSPTIVSADADLDLAARRIVWGKFYNAGQTCVAPDYVYVHSSVHEEFLRKIKATIHEQFGSNPKESQSYARIVNGKNFQRLLKLINPEKLVLGGESAEAENYIAPSIFTKVEWTDDIMKEEIFGPLLPVLSYDSLDAVFQQIARGPKPLSAYLFSSSSREQKDFVDKISFGGGCINDVIVHLSTPYLPFGGVGDSGMGNYHGESSFHTFSHRKSVMHRTGFLDFAARYAPYSDKKLNFLKKVLGL